MLGRVERFDDRLQFEIRSVEAADADPAGLAPRLRRDADELDGFLEFMAAELAHPGLRAVVGGSSATPRSGRRCASSRQPRPITRYAGGLLEHTVAVSTLVRETAQLHQRLRGDLLLSAALLHDVGRRARARARARRSGRPTRVACSATSTSG